MSVKAEDKDGNLILTLDNGDREKFIQAMKEWNFRDEQSILRYVISLLVLSGEKTELAYTDTEGHWTAAKPNTDLLKEETCK